MSKDCYYIPMGCMIFFKLWLKWWNWNSKKAYKIAYKRALKNPNQNIFCVIRKGGRKIYHFHRTGQISNAPLLEAYF